MADGTKGRAKQNVKVENMLDNHTLFALNILDMVMGSGKSDITIKDIRDTFPKDVEIPKLRGRSVVLKKRVETRLANRLTGPRVKDSLEDLL